MLHIATMRKVSFLLFALLSSSLVAANCRDKISSRGQCAYRILCTKTIRGIRLSDDCHGSTNYDVTVDVTLKDAMDKIDNNTDIDFLSFITSLTVYGNWYHTNLTILENMYRLRHLHLAGNKIIKIDNCPFQNLNNLETIDLSHNGLSDIEDLFHFESYPNRMMKLILSYNIIEEIPGDTFSELSNLIELDLSYNSITELSQEPFNNLTSLEILRLNNNHIKDLNGAMNNLYHLKQLYLRANKIQSVDVESLKIIHHLETFDISHNELEKVNPKMLSRHSLHMQNHSICRILLSKNHISFLSNTTNLEPFTRHARNPMKIRISVKTEIDLSKNTITHIEYNAFQSITQLISLDLSSNRLTSFDLNPKDLMYVSYLNLSTNYISQIYYESFSSMTYLQNLDLSHNRFDYVPDKALSSSVTFTHINMTDNDIMDVRSLRISFHPEGGILDLSNNSISTLHIPSHDAVFLCELILQNNNISDLSFIKLNDLHYLRRLDMSRNYITELDKFSLQLPFTLVFLDLSFNKIVRIDPSSFHHLNHLKTLRLSHNKLSDIQYGAFEGLHDLLNLDLSYNNIARLDSKVFLDLKFLSVLSLRHNNMNYLQYNTWLAHKFDLTVYLEDNAFSCNWLATAVNNFNNGYSKMRPTVLIPVSSGPSIEGIPCDQSSELLVDVSGSNSMSLDERLLVVCQKILEAVQEQTAYLRKNIVISLGYHSYTRLSTTVPKHILLKAVLRLFNRWFFLAVFPSTSTQVLC